MNWTSKLNFLIVMALVSELALASAKDDIEEFSNIVKTGDYACDEQFTVLFGNGFKVNESSAKDAIQLLQKRVESDPQLVPDLKEKTTYNNIYNSTHLFGAADAGEIILQKPAAEISQMLSYLAGDSKSPNWFQRLMEKLLKANNSIRSNLLSTTQGHTEIYNSLLAKGRQISAVTHSQGNLFINDAYLSIREPLKQGIGIVSVANPDDVVADQDSRHKFENTQGFNRSGDIYFLNIYQDYVMNWLGSGELNFDNYNGARDATHDPLGHSFIKAYLDKTAPHQPNAAEVIVDETIARHDKTTPAKCRTAFFSPPNDLQQWLGKKSKRVVDNNGQLEAIQYPTNVATLGSKYTLLDWKGQFKNSVATKSLSYVGPAARFMGGHFSNFIFRDGLQFYKAPDDHSILGAALTVDSNDQEWVIAVTGEISDNFKNNYVWRRKVKKIQDLTVPDLNIATSDPLQTGEPYWEKLTTIFGGVNDNTSHYTGWFFNGDGTEAQTVRWNKEDYVFGDNYCGHDELCADDYTLSREVKVLERHKLTLTGDRSVVSKSNLGSETGESGVVGVDYLDDQELVLRVKNTRSSNDPLNVSVDDSTWLEINAEPLMDTRILQCVQSASFACRPWIFDTAILQDSQGLVLNMHALNNNPDIQNSNSSNLGTSVGTGSQITQNQLLHLYHLDMRTKTFEYSSVVKNETKNQFENGKSPQGPFSTGEADAGYYYSHQGNDPVLIGTVKVTNANILTTSNGLYHTPAYYSDGRAGSWGNMNVGKYLVAPIRGQYQVVGPDIVPPMPLQMGRVVEPDGSLLISYELPDGTFFNYYSKENIEALAGVSLSNSTVLPLGLN